MVCSTTHVALRRVGAVARRMWSRSQRNRKPLSEVLPCGELPGDATGLPSEFVWLYPLGSSLEDAIRFLFTEAPKEAVVEAMWRVELSTAVTLCKLAYRFVDPCPSFAACMQAVKALPGLWEAVAPAALRACEGRGFGLHSVFCVDDAGSEIDTTAESRARFAGTVITTRDWFRGAILEDIPCRWSLMKYGDQDQAEFFGARLADLVWKVLGEFLDKEPHNIVLVKPAAQKLPTAATLVADALAQRLPKEVAVTALRREGGLVRDFGTLTDEERAKVKLPFHYPADGPILTGKFVVFAEDAVVTGAHTVQSRRVLIEAGAAPEAIISLCVMDIFRPAIVEGTKPLEAQMNEFVYDPSHPSVVDRLAVAARRQTMVTPLVRQPTNRFCKFVIGSLSTEMQLSLMHRMDASQQVWLLNGMVVDGLIAKDPRWARGFKMMFSALPEEEKGVPALQNGLAASLRVVSVAQWRKVFTVVNSALILRGERRQQASGRVSWQRCGKKCRMVVAFLM